VTTSPSMLPVPHPRLGIAAACLAAAVLLVAFGCSKNGNPTGPGTGAKTYLGLAANPDSADPPDSVASAIFTSIETGVTMWSFAPLWTEIEPDSGAYQTAGIRDPALILNALGLPVYVNLRVVDTNQLSLPPYLAGVALDSPRYEARLDALVDTLLGTLEGVDVLAVSIGNEVDAYFAAHPGEFPAWQALFARQRARMRARRPGLSVGCCTISPVGNPRAWVGDALNADADLRIYTYYPFLPASDFQHGPPSTLEPDFAAMAAWRPGPAAWALQEVGYSSSPANGSSPALQAEFVRRFRATVATSTRSSLLFASWFLYSDLPQNVVDDLLVYYGGSSPGFTAYLKNLGLRRSDGTPKPAWDAWRGLP
jgi:hypothetical protein